MASIKNLKKDINYTLGAIATICDDWQKKNPSEDMTASNAILDDAYNAYDDLLNKVNSNDVENAKSYFKTLSKELESKAVALLERANNL
ncbi:hypothetical protein SAMN04489761_3929 [Tenacibaculum sp. MAR_2009_124]|uniref:hypothetical protein n=1 Tax=Tenacibaculum sp. MAR_2009_124 TaxID=1250059 RepID=UPI00089D98B9|nr:hypothetical protein [Tenacibaculum sp. MAR_2009_124]SEC90693.1 hypothetical protein SAMN04489761_3929 [Tenacibaculum sp. MAR_2009_124]